VGRYISDIDMPTKTYPLVLQPRTFNMYFIDPVLVMLINLSFAIQ